MHIMMGYCSVLGQMNHPVTGTSLVPRSEPWREKSTLAQWKSGSQSTAAHGWRQGPKCHPASLHTCPLRSQCPRVHRGAKFAGEAFLIVRVSAKQSLWGVCLSGRQGQGRVLPCAISLQSRKLHTGFPGACSSRNPFLKPVAPGWWNEKPLNCFHKWSSKCKYSGWTIGSLFFRLSSKAWEEQHGNGVFIPPLPINKSTCVHIHPRERVHSYPSLVLRDLKHLSKAYIWHI